LYLTTPALIRIGNALAANNRLNRLVLATEMWGSRRAQMPFVGRAKKARERLACEKKGQKKSPTGPGAAHPTVELIRQTIN
jgi:hypothetical protein